MTLSNNTIFNTGNAAIGLRVTNNGGIDFDERLNCNLTDDGTGSSVQTNADAFSASVAGDASFGGEVGHAFTPLAGAGLNRCTPCPTSVDATGDARANACVPGALNER